ncbi:hypothetical protein [Pararhodobacter sp.]|uniref:hypothetical protein n=1 Tax=Pararhodobacter sp. TaxID=2127056 RepID=UPI002FDED6DF
MSALTVRPWGVGYAIWQGDKRVTGQIGNAAIAERTADLLTIKSQAKPRPCLCCNATFISAGPGNRLCDTCRRYAAQIVT